jgi:hypothetical protein
MWQKNDNWQDKCMKLCWTCLATVTTLLQKYAVLSSKCVKNNVVGNSLGSGLDSTGSGHSPAKSVLFSCYDPLVPTVYFTYLLKKLNQLQHTETYIQLQLLHDFAHLSLSVFPKGLSARLLFWLTLTKHPELKLRRWGLRTIPSCSLRIRSRGSPDRRLKKKHFSTDLFIFS